MPRLQAEVGVLAQHRLLELAEVRPGFDAQLADKQLARAAEQLERVGLPAAAVQGEHEQRARPLA